MIVNYAGIDVMASRDRVMSVFRPRELGFVPLRAHRYMRYLTVGPDGHLYITTFGFNRQTAIAGPGQLACKPGVWFGWKILIRNHLSLDVRVLGLTEAVDSQWWRESEVLHRVKDSGVYSVLRGLGCSGQGSEPIISRALVITEQSKTPQTPVRVMGRNVE
jgi:hypothetical protein